MIGAADHDRIALHTSTPSMSGSPRSRMMSDGCSAAARSIPARPVAASTTLAMPGSIAFRTTRRICGSSSMTRATSWSWAGTEAGEIRDHAEFVCVEAWQKSRPPRNAAASRFRKFARTVSRPNAPPRRPNYANYARASVIRPAAGVGKHCANGANNTSKSAGATWSRANSASAASSAAPWAAAKMRRSADVQRGTV